MTLWPAMAGIDAAMAGYGRYRCSYGPKTKIADESTGRKARGADEAGRVGIGSDEKGKFVVPTN